jgi:hypothetical protein
MLLRPAVLAGLRRHERACKSSVLLGSHSLPPPESFSLHHAVIEPEDADKLHLLNCGFAACTEGRSGRLADLDASLLPPETRQRAASFAADLRFAPGLALVLACADAVSGPWVIIDGNHRAIAQQLRHGSLNWMPVWLCAHPEIATWAYVPASFRQQAAEQPCAHNPAWSILRCCACVKLNHEQRQRLSAACAGFAAWDELILTAEAEGMAPLLLHHLTAAGVSLPDAARRTLRLLCVHHRQSNLVLISTLARTLTLLERQSIPALVFNGAALCQTLHPESGLRPLSSIDLLLADKDMAPACELLRQHGFLDIPEAAQPHSVALRQTAEGLHVRLQLHRELFPSLPPNEQQPDFAGLLRNAESFSINGVQARALAAGDMLRHLCAAASASCKLLARAEIAALLERQNDLPAPQ